MTVEDDIRTACRAYGRVYGPQIIKEYGYSSTTVYQALRRMFKAGELDRRIHFVEGYKTPCLYQYWLTEDPEGVE